MFSLIQVVEKNDVVEDGPALINQSPGHEGWMYRQGFTVYSTHQPEYSTEGWMYRQGCTAYSTHQPEYSTEGWMQRQGCTVYSTHHSEYRTRGLDVQGGLYSVQHSSTRVQDTRSGCTGRVVLCTALINQSTAQKAGCKDRVVQRTALIHQSTGQKAGCKDGVVQCTALINQSTGHKGWMYSQGCTAYSTHQPEYMTEGLDVQVGLYSVQLSSTRGHIDKNPNGSFSPPTP